MADRPRVVLDCVILLQAAARGKSAAASCLELAEDSRIEIFVSEETLAEIQDVLDRPEIRAQFADLNDEVAGAFLKRLRTLSTFVDDIPKRFYYPRDEDDEPYINLAIAADADYLVTRDTDLLDLMIGHTSEAKGFRQRFRTIRVITPEQFLNQPNVRTRTANKPT